MWDDRILKVTNRTTGQSATFKMEVPDPIDDEKYGHANGEWYDGSPAAFGASEGRFHWSYRTISFHSKRMPELLMRFLTNFEYPPAVGASGLGRIYPDGPGKTGFLSKNGGEISWLVQTTVVEPRSTDAKDSD